MWIFHAMSIKNPYNTKILFYESCNGCNFFMQTASKIALIGVAVPTSKSELATVITQDFFADFLDIIPTCWNVDGQKFTSNIWTMRVNN